nr:intein containing DNA-directed RNA polymerase subunit RPB2 [Cedratvirus lena]
MDTIQDKIMNSPFVPPLKKVTETLDEFNSLLPGGIRISENGELLKSYITYSGFTGDIINNYNNFIIKELPEQLRARPLRLADGYLVYFLNPFADKPVIEASDGKVPLLPITARQRNLTYSSPFYAELVLVNNGKEVARHNKPVFIGKVPVMTGSILCHLYGLSDQEKMEIGECPQDPLGYFIIKGTEKIIFFQEKLRLNRYLIFNTKKRGVVCRFTSYTSKGTSLIDLVKGDNKSIRLALHFLGKEKTMPVFLAFRILLGYHGLLTEGSDVLQIITWFVLTFTPEKHRKKIQAVLQSSLIEVAGIANSYEYLRTLNPKEISDVELARALTDDLFPQTTDVTNKLFMLALMTSQYALYIAGLRGVDDRDSVSNKRFESAGVSLQQLFGSLWNKTITNAEASIEETTKSSKGAIRGDVLAMVSKFLKFNIMTEALVDTFTPGSWGIKGSYAKNNITDTLNRESVLSTYAQLTKINTPTRREAKQPHIRMVQMTQLGFIDAIETPEGRAVGLIKHKAIGAQSTPAEDDRLIIKQVLPLLNVTYSEQTPNGVLCNGKFIGWGLGEKVRQMVVDMRRKRTVPQFTSVVLHYDNVLYISTDSSRLARPLLIVDDEDPDFTIYEKKKLEGADFQTLLEEGAAEFIDAMEQEHLYIAQSLDDLRKRRARLESVLKKVEEARSLVNRLEASSQSPSSLREILPKKRIVDDMEIAINLSNMVDEDIFELYQNTVDQAKNELSLAENALERAIEQEKPFTHVEMDPNSLLSISASLVPLPDNNMGPRNMYTCSMMKQALGIYHSGHNLRFDSTIKMLATPTPPIFQTQTNEWLGMNELPAGDTVIVALTPYYGFNQEDAFVFNKASIERGLFSYIIYTSYGAVESKKGGDVVETFMKPKVDKPSAKRDVYHALGDNGVAEIGRAVEAGDVLISKSKRNTVTGKVDVENVRLGIGERGVVERVLIDRNEEGLKIIKVKIREVRLSSDPVIGDKLASRYAQKGTIGLIVPPEDMPFTAEGMVPDIVINPLCFTSDTTVSLFNGLSRKISSMKEEGGMKIWTWTKEGLMQGEQIEMAPKGKKKVVKLTLEDGRTIRCTPDHRFLVTDGEEHKWVEAQNLELFSDSETPSRLVMGLESVLDESDEDEKDWSVETSDFTFSMSDEEEREKSLAFARILGLVLSDGCLYEFMENNKLAYQSRVNLGHMLDVQALLHDIVLITGKSPKVMWDKVCWALNLPRPLARSLASLDNITKGRRSQQEDTLPSFLLSPDCPKSIVREFLAGLFGGDGHVPIFSDHKNRKKRGASFISGVAFSQTIPEKFLDSMKEKMSTIINLLTKVGVEGAVLDKPRRVQYSETSYKPKDYKTNPRMEVKLRLPARTSFCSKVGFRYCVQKQCRLTAANSYWRFQEKVKEQHDKVIKRALELIQNKDERVMRGSRAHSQTALDISRKEFLEHELPLNEHYSLSSLLDLNNRKAYSKRRGCDNISMKQFDYKFISDAHHYLSEIGCRGWFEKGYVVKKEMECVPTFNLRVLDRREDGEEEVYDISVKETENFLANSAVVHNCIPSRMTIGKLMEIVASKVGALRGERVNATAFNNFDIKGFEEALPQYGYERRGTEKLFSGVTGKPLDADIFIGPCYYMMLRHLVKGKMQIRSSALYQAVSHQPVGGRSKGGALRIGNMEKNAMLSHGASDSLVDSFMYRSDAYEAIFCTSCGSIAIASDMYDNPICRQCEDKAKFGRASIPYASVWLKSLLTGAGINLRYKFEEKTTL